MTKHDSVNISEYFSYTFSNWERLLIKEEFSRLNARKPTSACRWFNSPSVWRKPKVVLKVRYASAPGGISNVNKYYLISRSSKSTRSVILSSWSCANCWKKYTSNRKRPPACSRGSTRKLLSISRSRSTLWPKLNPGKYENIDGAGEILGETCARVCIACFTVAGVQPAHFSNIKISKRLRRVSWLVANAFLLTFPPTCDFFTLLFISLSAFLV